MALGSGAASGGCPSPVLVLGLLDGAAPLPRRRALLQCKPRFIHLKRQYFLSSKINPVDSLSLHLKIHFTASSKKKKRRKKNTALVHRSRRAAHGSSRPAAEAHRRAGAVPHGPPVCFPVLRRRGVQKPMSGAVYSEKLWIAFV